MHCEVSLTMLCKLATLQLCNVSTVQLQLCIVATVQCGNVIGSASSFFFRSRKSRAMPPTNFFLPPGWWHQPLQILLSPVAPIPPESSAGQSLLFPIHKQSLTADGQWAKFASSLLRRLVVDWTTATNRWYSTSTQKVIKSGISLLRVAEPPPRWALLELCVHCTVCIALCTKCWFPLHSCALSGFAFMTVQKVTKVLHPTSMKFIIFMFQIIRYSLKWIPNDKIFPEQNIWALQRWFVCLLVNKPPIESQERSTN